MGVLIFEQSKAIGSSNNHFVGVIYAYLCVSILVC